MGELPAWAVGVMLVLGPGGAAWYGTKVGLNGVRADIKGIRQWLGKIDTRTQEHGERLARIEGASQRDNQLDARVGDLERRDDAAHHAPAQRLGHDASADA